MRRTMPLFAAMVGVGALLAGLIACGPASSGGGSPATEAVATEEQNTQASGSVMPTIDPCAIVTQDEATAFFGTASDAGDPSVGSLTAECDYRTTTDGLSLILAYVQDGPAVNSDQFKYMKQGNQDVPGLGDGACWLVNSGQLDVAKGSWILTLNGAIKGQPATLDTLTAMAQTAIGRLP